MSEEEKTYLDRLTYKPGDLDLVKRGTGTPLSEQQKTEERRAIKAAERFSRRKRGSLGLAEIRAFLDRNYPDVAAETAANVWHRLHERYLYGRLR
jgi:hypothetical protein